MGRKTLGIIPEVECDPNVFVIFQNVKSNTPVCSLRGRGSYTIAGRVVSEIYVTAHAPATIPAHIRQYTNTQVSEYVSTAYEYVLRSWEYLKRT